MYWAQSMLVIMRKELGLVRRHIDVHRAIGLAPFAGETKIQRVLYAFIAPAIFPNQIAIEHFPEQPSAATRGMLLFTRDHVTGAHRSVLMPPAFAHPDATLHCIRKAPVIVRIFEMRLPLRRVVVLAITQIFVPPVRPNDLARVHFPVWLPNFLELADCLHEFVAEHF